MTVSTTGDEVLQHLGSRSIGGKGQLDRQLRCRNFNCSPEGGDGGEERELTALGISYPYQGGEDLSRRGHCGGIALVFGRRVARYLVQEGSESWVPRQGNLALEPPDEVRPHLAKVDDPAGQAQRMQADPHHVHSASSNTGSIHSPSAM